MRQVYPVYLTKIEDGEYFVRVPDLGCCTEGKNLVDAIYMARDAIGLQCVALEDLGQDVPKPFSVDYVPEHGEDRTLVDIDIKAYRNSLETRKVKKNCTIPYSLEVEAEKYNLNFSQLLTDAIKNKLAELSV